MSAARPDFLYIDTAESLAAFCEILATKPYFAIDTEFLRERTYRPQLCLIQIKSEECLACIDTQAFEDLTPLFECLANPDMTKVLHAASQDLEIFYMLTKNVPAPIFDTQLAAPLLGYNEQIGYGNLVKEHLNIELAKAHTRADWTRRPLPEQQIAYALDDVIYLEKLYLSIRDQLQKLNRLQWLAPEFAAWEDPIKYDQPAADRWLRIRNIQKYKGPALAIIQALAEWREIKARETNLPRNWLLKDDVLCSLAQQQPDSESELAHIRSLDKKTRSRFGVEIVNIVKEARTHSPKPLPPFIKKKKLTEANRARMALINAWIIQRAAELKINPGILTPAKVLEKCVSGDPQEALQGWRKPLLLNDVEALLQGKLAIQATENGLVLQATRA